MTIPERDAIVSLVAPPSVDLRTLLGEMTALKTEVRAETRSARELRADLSSSVDTLRAELDAAHARTARLREVAGAAKQVAASQSALALVDLADRLASTRRSAAALAAERGRRPRRGGRFWGRFGRMFRRRRKNVDTPDEAARSLIEGLDLTCRRTAAHLRALGVEAIPTIGRAFDPNTMEAVSAVQHPDRADGEVVEEVTAGYRGVDGVLRTAQVVVNRHAKGSRKNSFPAPRASRRPAGEART